MGTATDSRQRATIMLASGELDKALTAFEIATGFAAMGIHVDMWFTLYGVNCLRKPRSVWSWRKWLPRKRPTGSGRMPHTDSTLQYLMATMNHANSNHLPLSQNNLFGAGPWLLNRIMRRKGIASLDKLIQAADSLGIQFKICQVCIDAFALNVEEELLVQAEVLGISTYALDAQNSHYNVVI